MPEVQQCSRACLAVPSAEDEPDWALQRGHATGKFWRRNIGIALLEQRAANQLRQESELRNSLAQFAPAAMK